MSSSSLKSPSSKAKRNKPVNLFLPKDDEPRELGGNKNVGSTSGSNCSLDDDSEKSLAAQSLNAEMYVL